MWPLIIGAVSQASDPAKKLADDYCAYVISQGGVVDYATVYNIYKDEYLTDPNKEKLVDWYDLRGGGIFEEIEGVVYIRKIFSLTFPYRDTYEYSSNAGSLINSEKIEGVIRLSGSTHLNIYNGNLNFVSKVDTKNISTTGSYNYNVYQDITNTIFMSMRPYWYGQTRRFYNYDTGANTVLFSQYPNSDGAHIFEQEVDYVNMKRRIRQNGELFSETNIIAGSQPYTIGYADPYIGGTPENGLYYLKIYHL